jgi:hypothetical protein
VRQIPRSQKQNRNRKRGPSRAAPHVPVGGKTVHHDLREKFFGARMQSEFSVLGIAASPLLAFDCQTQKQNNLCVCNDTTTDSAILKISHPILRFSLDRFFGTVSYCGSRFGGRGSARADRVEDVQHESARATEPVRVINAKKSSASPTPRPHAKCEALL